MTRSRSQKFRVSVTVAALIFLYISSAVVDAIGTAVGVPIVDVFMLLIPITGGFAYAALGTRVSKKRAALKSARALGLIIFVGLGAWWIIAMAVFTIIDDPYGVVELWKSDGVVHIFLMWNALYVVAGATLGAVGGFLAGVVRAPVDPTAAISTEDSSTLSVTPNVDPWA